jgi:hypothetical protein
MRFPERRSFLWVKIFSTLFLTSFSMAWADAVVPVGVPHPPVGLAGCPDHRHGVFVAWTVEQGSSTWIAVQRLDFRGHARWDPPGIVLGKSVGSKKDLQVLTGKGEMAFLAYLSEDRVSVPTPWQLRLQGLDGRGHLRWPDPGVLIASGPFIRGVKMEVNAQGTLAIVWVSGPDGDAQVHWQRVDAQGSIRWLSGGLTISEGDVGVPALAHDAQGSFFVFWHQGEPPPGRILGNYFNAEGKPLWPPGGMTVAPKSYAPGQLAAVCAPRNDVVVVWKDQTPSGALGWAQSLDVSGARLWSDEGLLLTQEVSGQDAPRFALNREGQLVAAWIDVNSSPHHVYLQRWDKYGRALWSTGGVPVSPSSLDNPQSPQVLADSQEPYIVWREGDPAGGRLSSERFNAEGTPAWDPPVAVRTQSSLALDPVLLEDDYGGMIALWAEHTLSEGYHLRATRIARDGARLW